MRKYIVAGFITFIIPLFSKAQTLNFGPEVGVNLNNFLTDQSGYKSDFKTGLKAGFNVNLPVGRNFFIGTGLFYIQRGQKADYQNQGIQMRDYYTMGYIMLPFEFVYRVRINNGRAGSIYLGAGPYIGYGIHGRIQRNNIINDGSLVSLSNDKINWGYDDGEVRPLDFGLAASIRYELPMGLYAKAQYGYGLAIIDSDHNTSFSHQSIQLSIGLNFWTWVY